jgi:hypothetical protein
MKPAPLQKGRRAPATPGERGHAPPGRRHRLRFDEEMLAAVDATADGAVLTPWLGYGVLLAWVVAIVALAVTRLRRGDA